MVQCLPLCLPMQGEWVQSVIGKLRSHMFHRQEIQNINNRSNCCNMSNKDFKMVHIKKKILKKIAGNDEQLFFPIFGSVCNLCSQL